MRYSIADLPILLRSAAVSSARSPSADLASQETLRSGSSMSADEKVSSFFDHVNLDEALAIYSVVRELKPRVSFEIGFCSGASGLAILTALRDAGHGRHISCDPYQTSYARNAGRKNVAEAGLADRWTFREKFPEEVSGELPPIQFAFIDASHLFDLSMLDFALVDKRLEVGGVVGFHDMWMPSLRKAVRYILNNRGYKIFRLPGQALPTRRTRAWKRIVARLLGSLPKSESIFAQELLVPWSSFGFGNLAFLQKVSVDNRDWRFHRAF